MKTFYFTGTGNSLQVARGISAQGELISIPQFLREHKDNTEHITVEAETIGLVFPTYWLAVPSLVIEFLSRVRFKTDYLFAVVTRGNASLTLKSHLLQVARQNGHSISYYNQLNMPDNYLLLCDMAKEKQRYHEEALARHIKALATDIRAHTRNVSGHAALTFLRPALIRRASKESRDFSRHFSINEACSGCGTCVRVCSAQSIRLVEGMPRYGGACNACLACIHNCPAGAIHMQKEKSSERYLNPTVRTADIISAHS